MILRLRSRPKGFTLFELLLVFTLAIVITTIGVVSLSRLQNTFRLRSSADEVKAMLQLGRELAISNKNQTKYNISISGRIVALQSPKEVISRYQIPFGVSISPPSLNWEYTPLTGGLVACSSCLITLSAGSQIEIINIQENGLVN